MNVLTVISTRLGGLLTDKIPLILDAVFECTLSMINKDFTEFPEHRVAFFNFLRITALHCFPALLTLPPQQFKLIIDSTVWAFKHPSRDIADTGLNLCHELINNFALSEVCVANVFFSEFYLPILQDVFFVLTDTDHKAGFKIQSIVLARMFALVENDDIKVPLYAPSQAPEGTPNAVFLRQHVINLLRNAFTHLQR